MSKKRYLWGVLIVLGCFIQCQNKKIPNPVDLSKAILKIDSCGLYYNQHRLNLGDNFKDWEKVLGKYDRKIRGYLIWDKLGIAVSIYWNNKKYMKQMNYGSYEFIRGRPVDELRIFFLNLDSPEGKAGNLNHARGWTPFNEEWRKNILKNKRFSVTENTKRAKKTKEKNHPKHYIYPFKVYQGYVNLHGFPVASGMDVAAINAYRGDLYFSGKFGYVDQDIDGVNDSGNTTDTFGGDYKASGKECKNGRLQYYRLTYTPTGALEYLKIGHEGERNYQSRQRVKARRKKEKEALLNQGEKNE